MEGTTTILIRQVPQELHNRFKSTCAIKAVSMQEMMIELIKGFVSEEEFLQKHPIQPEPKKKAKVTA